MLTKIVKMYFVIETFNKKTFFCRVMAWPDWISFNLHEAVTLASNCFLGSKRKFVSERCKDSTNDGYVPALLSFGPDQ